jgi:hypothetical protein
VANWNAQIAQAHALSGAPIWTGIAWAAAWIACGLVPRESGRSVARGAGYVPGLVVCGAAFALLANLAWWAGLVTLPWLVFSRDPAKRMLGVWWLLLSLMTPFYHPYARLWLPTQAAGWILAAGVVSKLTEYGCARSSTGEQRPPKVILWGALTTVVAAAIQVGTLRPVSFPTAWVLAPNATLRAAAFAPLLAKNPDLEYQPIVVLARRPLAFYLTLGHHRVDLVPDLGALLRYRRPGAQAFVDESIVHRLHWPRAQNGEPDLDGWVVEHRFDDALDPVALLDFDPTSAYKKEPSRTVSLWLLTRPRSGSTNHRPD